MTAAPRKAEDIAQRPGQWLVSTIIMTTAGIVFLTAETREASTSY
jgi:hypothetical protein